MLTYHCNFIIVYLTSKNFMWLLIFIYFLPSNFFFLWDTKKPNLLKRHELKHQVVDKLNSSHDIVTDGHFIQHVPNDEQLR